MNGILVKFAGRGLAIYDTQEEAEASFRQPHAMDGIERSHRTLEWALNSTNMTHDQCAAFADRMAVIEAHCCQCRTCSARLRRWLNTGEMD